MHYVHFFNEEVTNNKKRKQPFSFKLLQTRVKTSDFKQYINGISIINSKEKILFIIITILLIRVLRLLMIVV